MLRVVLPKGSLEKATMELFEAADLPVIRSSAVDYKAASECTHSALEQAERDAGAQVVAGGRWLLRCSGLVDEDELRVASRKTDFDVPVRELCVERQRGLREEVDQPQPQ